MHLERMSSHHDCLKKALLYFLYSQQWSLSQVMTCHCPVCKLEVLLCLILWNIFLSFFLLTFCKCGVFSKACSYENCIYLISYPVFLVSGLVTVATDWVAAVPTSESGSGCQGDGAASIPCIYYFGKKELTLNGKHMEVWGGWIIEEYLYLYFYLWFSVTLFVWLSFFPSLSSSVSHTSGELGCVSGSAAVHCHHRNRCDTVHSAELYL